MARRLRNVWAAACPTCHVGVNEYCRDLRSQTGLLFGRRTHKARAKAVREMVSTKYVQPTISLNVNSTGTFVYDPEVWQRWNAGVINMTTAINNATISINQINTDRIWTGWINTAATTTITGDQVWRDWQQAQPVTYRQLEQMTQADLAQARRERDSRQALWAAQEAERVERRIRAISRAQELLEMILTPDQREERVRSGEVTVTAPSGRRYVVEMNRQTVHGNIVEIDAHGCRLRRGCVAPGMYDEGGAFPTADGWVGQILAIQHNEEELRLRANWSQIRSCTQPEVPILERAA